MPRRDDLEYYADRFASMKFLGTQSITAIDKRNGKTFVKSLNWPKLIDQGLDAIVKGKSLYIASEAATGVPWFFIAGLHYRERGCNFMYQVLNGEPYRFKTTKVPVGYGPWPDWPSSTRFAMAHWKMKFPEWKDKTLIVPKMIMEWEDWNGEGYENWHKKDSPYSWSGSDHGLGLGKYASDGKYDPNMVDQQVGCAVLLRAAMDRGIWTP